MLNVDHARRTIDGRAVPYDTIAHPKLALPRRFPFGSLTWSEPWHVRLLLEHNNSLHVGRVLNFNETEFGLWATFRVRNGPEGDLALEMAATTHGGLSIGLVDDEFRVTDDGIQECVRGRITEISLTKDPVFS
jgi:phage head maturation protease